MEVKRVKRKPCCIFKSGGRRASKETKQDLASRAVSDALALEEGGPEANVDRTDRKRLGKHLVCSVIMPVTRRASTARRRAIQMIRGVLILPDINHPATDHFPAQGATPVVVERNPFSLRVGPLQRSQLFIKWYMPVLPHFHPIREFVGSPVAGCVFERESSVRNFAISFAKRLFADHRNSPSWVTDEARRSKGLSSAALRRRIFSV